MHKTFLIAYCLDHEEDETKLREALDSIKLGPYHLTGDITDRSLEVVLWNADPSAYQSYIRRDVEYEGRE